MSAFYRFTSADQGSLTPSPLPAGDFTLAVWLRLQRPFEGVKFYANADWTGAAVVLPPGRYEDLAKRLPPGFVPRSAICHGNLRVVSFANEGCQGAATKLVTEPSANLALGKSLCIWDLAAPHGHLVQANGDSGSWVLDQFAYQDLVASKMTITSLWVPPNLKVTVYSAANFGGNRKEVTGSVKLGKFTVASLLVSAVPLAEAPPPSQRQINVCGADAKAGVALDWLPPAHENAPPSVQFQGKTMLFEHWHLLTVVQQGKTLAYYKDGSQIATDKVKPNAAAPSKWMFGIGLDGEASLPALWGRALSADEVRALKQADPFTGDAKLKASGGLRAVDLPLPKPLLQATAVMKMQAAMQQEHADRIHAATEAKATKVAQAHEKALTRVQAAQHHLDARVAFQNVVCVCGLELGMPHLAGHPGRFNQWEGNPNSLGRTATSVHGTNVGGGSTLMLVSGSSCSLIDTSQVSNFRDGGNPPTVTCSELILAAVYVPAAEYLARYLIPKEHYGTEIGKLIYAANIIILTASGRLLAHEIDTGCELELAVSPQVVNPGAPHLLSFRDGSILIANGREIWGLEMPDTFAMVAFADQFPETVERFFELHPDAKPPYGGKNLRPVVSTGRSPQPIAVVYSKKVNAIFWVDKEMGKVRTMDAKSGLMRDLYPATNPRPALALDEALERIYWNSEYHEQMETAIIAKPGLFAWVQCSDAADPVAGQRVPVLEDFLGHKVTTAAPSKPPKWLPFSQAMQFDVKQESYLSLGPMLVDCRRGFSLEIAFCADQVIAQRDPDQHNTPVTLLQLGHSQAESMIRLSLDEANVTLEVTVNWITQKISVPLAANGKGIVGKWCHVFATLDADGSARLTSGGNGDAQTATGMLPLPTEPLWQKNLIGCGLFHTQFQVSTTTPYGNYGGYFQGSIAFVRLWNQCLAEKAITPGQPTVEATGERPTHHRSVLDAKIGEKWLMSGSFDGGTLPVPIYEFATDHGMVVLTHEEQADDALAKAQADLLKQQAEQRQKLNAKAAELNATQTLATANRKDAKEKYDVANATSSAQIAIAQTDQAVAKLVNFLKKTAKQFSNRQRTDRATSNADAQRASHAAQAKLDQAAAYDKAYAPVNQARQDLANAQSRAKEKGIKLPPPPNPS